jgi:DEAD/DEAH box helicase domain-containing protein
VVDELHTFDGAQGTDLACLTRRLKARLGVERGALVCVGTSATLGTEESREDLLRYAERIFDEPFGSEAVVGETRQTVDEFLGDTLITYTLGVPPDVEAIVDHTRYRGVEEYLRAQHRLFFGTDIEGAFEDSEWRLNLGERLRRHAFFVNLLRVLERQPRSLAAIVERFRGAVSVDSERTLGHLLNALCALLATARARAAPTQGPADLEGQTSQLATTAPLVQLRLQLWVR